MRIFTSRYQNSAGIIEADVAPIRTTLYPPRFKLEYRLAGTLSEAAPEAAWFHAPDHVFEARYEEKLESAGVDLIRQRLIILGTGRDVVLLCFEDVTRDPLACHRRLFAQWWETRTGETVAELVDRSPRRESRRQGQLFSDGLQEGLQASKAVQQKALRLLREGKVTRTANGWDVIGDTGTHRVTASGPAMLPEECTCPTVAVICSHRLAAYMLDPTNPKL